MYKIILILLIMSGGVLNSQPVWQCQNPLPQCNTLNDVKFINAATGFSAGDYGTILKTTNGGVNWVSQVSGITQDLKSVSFPNSSTGYTAGYYSTAAVLKTTNGGANWVSL